MLSYSYYSTAFFNFKAKDGFFTKNSVYSRTKHIFREEFLDYLKNFKFTCDVWAVPEGTPIFPGEVFKLISMSVNSSPEV